MRTQRQIDASRANGAKSRGPVTAQGKARSAQNAITHAVFTKAILVEGENAAAFQALLDGLLRVFLPVNEAEASMVYDMASARWRKERAEAYEAGLINLEIHELAASGPAPTTAEDLRLRAATAYAQSAARSRTLLNLDLQIARLRRQWHAAHCKLKELQIDREQAEKAASENEPNDPQPATPQQDTAEPRLDPAVPTLQVDPETGTVRRDGPKPGRNQPCPCRSGRKFKNCCGR